MDHNDPTAETLDLTQYATHGLCPNYTLKIHRHETLANAGCYEARRDWARYIGPAGEFGGCNPFNGNFTALVLPLCKPERLRLVAYIIEYAYLHDNVVEAMDPESSAEGDVWSLGKQEKTTSNVKAGRKQIQAKMMFQLNAMDKACAARVMGAWKTMYSTTRRDKSTDFRDLDEYLDFRVVDSAAYWVEACMLFGMGMTLTAEEDALLGDIARPCYAALALANDYFSFGHEVAALQNSPEATRQPIINAMWLFMKWRGVEPAVAKELTIEACNQQETLFLDLCEQFRREHAPLSPKLDLYLRALSYQIPGNVVWSLNCPRYYPDLRTYDPNAGVEDAITARYRPTQAPAISEKEMEGEDECQRRPLSMSSEESHGSSDSDVHTAYSWDRTASSRPFSMLPSPAVDETEQQTAPGIKLAAGDVLGAEHLDAPFAYVKSLPSKGVRDTLADALNLWAGLPEDTVTEIKGVVGDLHAASLMLDDIEDGSELRRGHPATHSVFGVPQTINAASCAIVEAVRKAHELSSTIPGSAEITFEQLRDLHIGQSYDLYWTRHALCPTEDEYLEMVSKSKSPLRSVLKRTVILMPETETGGLFRLLSRLMCSHLSGELALAIDNFMKAVGIYFQIRDDYANLSSDEYTNQKGFCEDLDEGKFSFPLVHHLATAPRHDALQVREILEQRREAGKHCLSEAHKRLVLQHLKDSKSVEYTRDTLKSLEGRIDSYIERLEGLTGRENWMLRLCMQKLRV